MCILLSLQPEKDKKRPSYTQQQPSHMPPIRNPFKAPGMEHKHDMVRHMHSGRSATKDEELRPPAEGHETCPKENVNVAIWGKELDPNSNISVTFRGKHLPLGIKKKVSNEEKNIPKENGVGKLQDKVKHVSDDDHRMPEEAKRSISTSSAKVVHSDKLSANTQDLQKDSEPKKPTNNSFTGVSKDWSSRGRPSDKTPQSSDSRSNPSHQNDDDVELLSVKAAAPKSPANAVQTTLTTFPGFQPASKVKISDDPRGLRSLFTAELQQVKVSVKDESPKKMEALYKHQFLTSFLTVIARLCFSLPSFAFFCEEDSICGECGCSARQRREAADSGQAAGGSTSISEPQTGFSPRFLSHSAAVYILTDNSNISVYQYFVAISDLQVKTNSSDAGQSKKHLDPFNQPGGTILLPSVPSCSSSGPSYQASGSMSGGRLSKKILEGNFFFFFNSVFSNH